MYICISIYIYVHLYIYISLYIDIYVYVYSVASLYCFIYFFNFIGQMLYFEYIKRAEITNGKTSSGIKVALFQEFHSQCVCVCM